MSENLEDLIRDLCKRGEMTHLSLVPRVISQGTKNVHGWGASFSPASTFGNTFGEDTDPVVALKNALNDAKLRRRPEFKDGEGAKVKPARAKPEPATEQDLSDLLG
jgi:hypothetical protein